MFSSTLGLGIVSPLLPLYARDLGASGIWLGSIFTAYFISFSIVTPIAGRLSDLKGRKLFLVIGLLAYAFISLGYIWAENIVQLSLVRLIQGAAGAVVSPIAFAYIGDLSPEREEGKWMGYANTAFWSGFGFGPLMGGALTEHFGIKTTFFGMGGLNLLAFAIAISLLPEATARKRRGATPYFSFREMGKSRVVKGLFSIRVTEALGRGGMMVFLPIFAAMLGLSITLIGTLLTVSSLLMFLLTPLGGIIADRFNRGALIILGQIIFTISLVAIPFTQNFGQLLAVLFFQSAGGAISMPAASALTVEEGRKFGMGSTMGIFMMAMSIGSAIGPIISGQMADLANVASVFYFGGVMGVIGSILFLRFTR